MLVNLIRQEFPRKSEKHRTADQRSKDDIILARGFSSCCQGNASEDKHNNESEKKLRAGLSQAPGFCRKRYECLEKARVALLGSKSGRSYAPVQMWKPLISIPVKTPILQLQGQSMKYRVKTRFEHNGRESTNVDKNSAGTTRELFPEESRQTISGNGNRRVLNRATNCDCSGMKSFRAALDSLQNEKQHAGNSVTTNPVLSGTPQGMKVRRREHYDGEFSLATQSKKATRHTGHRTDSSQEYNGLLGVRENSLKAKPNVECCDAKLTNSTNQTCCLKVLSPRRIPKSGQQSQTRSAPDVVNLPLELKFGVRNPTRRCTSCDCFKRQTPRPGTTRSFKGLAGLEPLTGREEPSRDLQAELENKNLKNEWISSPVQKLY